MIQYRVIWETTVPGALPSNSVEFTVRLLEVSTPCGIHHYVAQQGAYIGLKFKVDTRWQYKPDKFKAAVERLKKCLNEAESLRQEQRRFQCLPLGQLALNG